LKQFGKLSAKDKMRVRERLALFAKDQGHPLLRKHQLAGEYSGYSSINATGGLKVIFRYKDEDEIILFAVGTHSQLYR
jgi:mRNA-degrading endonuclease YafQ of YafQ-DinJ toxin-antitoxin module